MTNPTKHVSACQLHRMPLHGRPHLQYHGSSARSPTILSIRFIFHVLSMEMRTTSNKQQATKHCFSLRSMFCRMGFGFTEFHLQKRCFLQLVNPRPVASNSEHARRAGLPPLLRHPADASPPSRPHARPKHRRP